LALFLEFKGDGNVSYRGLSIEVGTPPI